MSQATAKALGSLTPTGVQATRSLGCLRARAIQVSEPIRSELEVVEVVSENPAPVADRLPELGAPPSAPRANAVGLRELASGIDALYLSGRASLTPELLDTLAAGRADAEELEEGIPYKFGGQDFMIAPRGFGKYRYWLRHRFGQLGVTPSEHLPSFRIQPTAEALHGLGPAQTVEWFRTVLEAQCGPVYLTVSRVDLHSDWQGWELDGDDRRRFLCRADARNLHEDGETFTGFEFGRRSSKTVCARIYNKTVDLAKKGADYWFDIWGPAFDPDLPVLRVEFEINRQGLREYFLNTPDQVLVCAGAMWSDLTDSWLSYRDPTSDETRSRWPVSSEWAQVRRARLALDAYDIHRIRAGSDQGDLRKLAPILVGGLTSFAAIAGCSDWEETARQLDDFVSGYGRESGQSFSSRVAIKRRNQLRS